MNMIKNLIRAILILPCFALFNSCGDSPLISNSLLKDEAVIIDIYEERIGSLSLRLKEAELKNRLQNQLDLKRELDSLIFEVNHSLKESLRRRENVLNVPFSKMSDSTNFVIREIRVSNCLFNSGIMDFQVQLVAFATSLKNGHKTIKAELCDSSGRALKTIHFIVTDDFPEKGKEVMLISHAEGKLVLRNLYKIKI